MQHIIFPCLNIIPIPVKAIMYVVFNKTSDFNKIYYLEETQSHLSDFKTLAS